MQVLLGPLRDGRKGPSKRIADPPPSLSTFSTFSIYVSCPTHARSMNYSGCRLRHRFSNYSGHRRLQRASATLTYCPRQYLYIVMIVFRRLSPKKIYESSFQEEHVFCCMFFILLKISVPCTAFLNRHGGIGRFYQHSPKWIDLTYMGFRYS